MTDIVRTPPPSVADVKTKTYGPQDTIPEIANTVMVKEILGKLPTFAIVSRKYTVFHGIVKGLNHTEQNPTYLDLSLLDAVLTEIEHESVNVDGYNIKNFWAFAMHPNYIIQGMPSVLQQEEKKPGILSKIGSWWSGKPNEPQAGGKS